MKYLVYAILSAIFFSIISAFAINAYAATNIEIVTMSGYIAKVRCAVDVGDDTLKMLTAPAPEEKKLSTDDPLPAESVKYLNDLTVVAEKAWASNNDVDRKKFCEYLKRVLE